MVDISNATKYFIAFCYPFFPVVAHFSGYISLRTSLETHKECFKELCKPFRLSFFSVLSRFFSPICVLCSCVLFVSLSIRCFFLCRCDTMHPYKNRNGNCWCRVVVVVAVIAFICSHSYAYSIDKRNQ